MLANTEEGDTYTLHEYREWLEAAGFSDFHPIEAPLPLKSVAPVETRQTFPGALTAGTQKITSSLTGGVSARGRKEAMRPLTFVLLHRGGERG